MRDRLRRVGEAVRADAEARFDQYDEHTAENFRVYVRRTGIVSIEQRLTKTTGLRPDWGALQMTKGLIPAADDKRWMLETEMEHALEDIAGILEGA